MTSDKSTIRPATGEGTTDASARRTVPPAAEAQLSSPGRVDTGVSSIALNAGFGGGLEAPRGTVALGTVEADGDVEMMLRVKAALDPEGLMNPQALLPGPSGDDPK